MAEIGIIVSLPDLKECRGGGGIPSPENFTLSDNVKHYGEIQVYMPTNFINRKLPHPQIEILRISKAVNQDFFSACQDFKKIFV